MRDELEFGSVLNLINQNDVPFAVPVDVNTCIWIIIARFVDLTFQRIGIGQTAFDEATYRVQSKVIGINRIGRFHLHIIYARCLFVTSANDKHT